MREFGGVAAAAVGLFPDSLQSVCISDFTRGKSSPSAAVNSGDVESAY